MVVNRGGSGPGERSGSGSGAGPLDDQMQEFILSEITRNILEQTLVIFVLINAGIMELMDERMGVFHIDMVALVGAHSLNF